MVPSTASSFSFPIDHQTRMAWPGSGCEKTHTYIYRDGTGTHSIEKQCICDVSLADSRAADLRLLHLAPFRNSPSPSPSIPIYSLKLSKINERGSPLFCSVCSRSPAKVYFKMINDCARTLKFPNALKWYVKRRKMSHWDSVREKPYLPYHTWRSENGRESRVGCFWGTNWSCGYRRPPPSLFLQKPSPSRVILGWHMDKLRQISCGCACAFGLGTHKSDIWKATGRRWREGGGEPSKQHLTTVDKIQVSSGQHTTLHA